jgi:hypothetical protein
MATWASRSPLRGAPAAAKSVSQSWDIEPGIAMSWEKLCVLGSTSAKIVEIANQPKARAVNNVAILNLSGAWVKVLGESLDCEHPFALDR